ncbi:MAG: polysaccharide biosynthesis C-terminal domain-containing protein [bacterium]|nr:MAG: polysaccharide biosynthesis C-terminal domain-containing protein [bacterium]
MAVERKKTLTLISFFSSARVLSEAFFFIRGLLLAKIFGPNTLGIWTQMKLVHMFFAYAHLGTSDAMMREVPYAVGRSDLLLAERIKSTTLGFNLIVSSCLAIFLCIYIFIPEESAVKALRSEWALFALVFLFSQVYWYAIIRLQAEKRIGRSSAMILGFAINSTVVGTVGAKYFGLGGFLMALGISYLLMLVWGGSLSFYRSPFLDLTLLRDLIRKGFPIMMSVALLMLLGNVDKIMIGLLMSTQDLGIYSLQSYITNLIMIIPHSVATVLYPSLMEKIGRIGDKKTLEGYLTQPTLTLAYLVCPLLGVIFLTIHLPIQWLLPQYIQAIVPGQILVSAVFFMAIASMPATILVSLNRQNMLLALTGVSVMVGAITDYILIKSGKGIIGAAIGTSLSFVIYSSLTMISSLHALKMSIKNSISFLVLIAIPYITVFILVYMICKFIPVTDAGWIPDFVYTTIGCFIILVLMAGLYYVVNLRFRLFEGKII